MKIKNIFGIFFSLLLVFSCSDEFLDRPTQTEISPASYWKTANDLQFYVNQFYGVFPQLYHNSYSGGVFWEDDNSDNMLYVSQDTRLLGNNTIMSGGGTWNSSYSQIRKINVMLENYSKVTTEGGIVFDNYKKYVGEAFFFRAYYYFNLLKTYGGVPFIDKVLTAESEELQAPRLKRNELTDKILNDLDSAIIYMPLGNQSNGNRLSSDIARLFKARVALYEGTWEKYHAGTDFNKTGLDGSAFLQIAATTAEPLVNSNTYGIENTGKPDFDYYNLFNRTDYSSSKEVMLWKQYSSELGLAHNAQRYLNASGGRRGITKELVDDYLCTDGDPIGVSPLYKGDHGLTQVATNRDGRLACSIWIPGQVWSTEGGVIRIVDKDSLDDMNKAVTKTVDGKEVIIKVKKEDRFSTSWLNSSGEGICPTGYQIRKGSNPAWEQRYTARVGTTSAPIFRVTEAYLIYAEAKAELGTLTQADADKTINKLRDRAGVADLDIANITTDPNWIYTGISPLIQEIRRERRVEFAAEGYRYDDLNRWAAHKDVTVNKIYRGVKFKLTDAEAPLFPGFNKELPINQYKYDKLLPDNKIKLDSKGYVIVFDKPYEFKLNRDYLYPIPYQQRILNKNLTNNPGWEE
jgi:hypothetical protein